MAAERLQKLIAAAGLASRRKAEELLGMVGLTRLGARPAGELPYGALKRLEIARALAAEPKVLLLDEPAAGCNAVETAEVEAALLAVPRVKEAVVIAEERNLTLRAQ